MITYEKYVCFRDSKGMKDSDVAKAANIPASTFSDWKKGKSKPKEAKLMKIAQALGFTYAYMMGWDDTPMNPASRAVEQIITTNEDLGGSSKAAEFFHRTAKSVDAPAAPSTNSDMVKLFPEEIKLVNDWRMADPQIKRMVVELLSFAVEQENKKNEH